MEPNKIKIMPKSSCQTEGFFLQWLLDSYSEQDQGTFFFHLNLRRLRGFTTEHGSPSRTNSKNEGGLVIYVYASH